MKRAFKSLFRKGESNVVKILCLGIGLAIGLTLICEVIFEYSYDNFIPGLKDTYRVEENFKNKNSDWDNYSRTPGAVAPGLRKYSSAVECATRFTPIDMMTLQDENKNEFSGRAWLCDSTFFKMFPRKILMGEDPYTGLEKSNNAYISSDLLKVVGTDIIGKTFSWNNFSKTRITIVGVFEAFPENSQLYGMDILVALPTISQFSYDGRNNWIGNDRYYSYVRLQKGTDPDELKGSVERMINDNVPVEEMKRAGIEVALTFRPMNEIYFSIEYNRIMNSIILAFGILMLLVAVFNYILLVISSMVNRAKSIATYRCYGAGSTDIYKMILSESLLHGLISLVLAVLIIFALGDFIQEQMAHSLSALFTPFAIGVCIFITLAVILLCGFMPGYLYTRIPVTYAYRRYSENKRLWKLGLLSVQFMLTAFFVAILTVISLEYKALTEYETGFAYKDVLYVDCGGIDKTESMRFIEALKKNPEVKDITWGYQFVGNSCSGNNIYNPDTGEEYMNIADMYWVGTDYHKTFDIPVIEGQVFDYSLNDSLSQQIMVSRSFVERMEKLAGWEGSAIGKPVFITEHEGMFTICGVYEDIHLGSQIAQATDSRPTVMFSSSRPYGGYIYIRMNNMSPESLDSVQKVADATIFSQNIFVKSLNVEMRNIYDMLLHIRNSVMFAGLSILIIAIIGLVAYIRDEMSRRRSEIAIRIIHGARIIDVQRLLLKDLSKIAIPSVVFGLLLSWHVSEYLLQLFSVKIPLTFGLFACVMLVVTIVIYSISSYLIYKVACVNPTENLKSE